MTEEEQQQQQLPTPPTIPPPQEHVEEEEEEEEEEEQESHHRYHKEEEDKEEEEEAIKGLETLRALKSAGMATEAVHRVADEMCRVPRSAASGKEALPREPMLGALRGLLAHVAREGGAGRPQRADVLALCAGAVGSSDVAAALVDAAFARRDDIRAAAGAECAAGVSGAQLVDFDWRAAVTVASDKAAGMSKASVSVGLTLAENSGAAQRQQQQQQRNIVFEADGAELDSLIQQLEKAANAIAALKV